MINVQFHYLNSWADKTLIASSEATGYPVENILERNRTVQWWTTAKTAQWVKINSTAVDMYMVAIFGHNLTSSATVKIQGSNDDFSTTPYDQQLTQGTGRNNRQWVHYASSKQTYDDWRIYLDDATNTSDNLKIGVFWHSASYLEPAHGFDVESAPIQIDPSILNIGAGGQESPIFRTKYKTINHGYPAIEIRPEMESMFFEVGTSKPMVILEKKYDSLTYDNKEDWTSYVRMTSMVPSGILQEKWKYQISFKEMQ